MTFFIFIVLSLCSFHINAETAEKAPIQVAYHLWYNSEPTNPLPEAQRHDLTVEDKSTFFQVMEKAAAAKPNEYGFEFVQYSFGKQITSIGGVENDGANNIYWMIYELTSAPHVDIPPTDDQQAQVGVDLLLVSNKKHYLFWRKDVGPPINSN